MTTGANRVVRGSRIEHVCGDPALGPEKDYAYGLRIGGVTRGTFIAQVRVRCAKIIGTGIYVP